MTPEREILLEILYRLRESQDTLKAISGPEKMRWVGRAEAFDEIYTELKGFGFGSGK